MALAAFALVHVKIANMIRMVKTGKLKLWRHTIPKTQRLVVRYFPLRKIWLGKCRVWKGARPKGCQKLANAADMRMVRVRKTRNTRIQELEQEIVKHKKLIKNCIPELEHLIPKHEKIICELRLLSTQLRRGYSV